MWSDFFTEPFFSCVMSPKPKVCRVTIFRTFLGHDLFVFHFSQRDILRYSFTGFTTLRRRGAAVRRYEPMLFHSNGPIETEKTRGDRIFRIC